jgi:hypothetical protein
MSVLAGGVVADPSYKKLTTQLVTSLGARGAAQRLQNPQHPVQLLYQALCQYPPQAVEDITATMVALTGAIQSGYTDQEKAEFYGLQSEHAALKERVNQEGLTAQSVSMLIRFIEVNKQELVNLSPVYHEQSTVQGRSYAPPAVSPGFDHVGEARVWGR